MKKVAVFGLVFALFLLPIVMPLAKADNTVSKVETLRRHHKRVRVRKIRQGLRTRNKGFLEGLTAEERQAAKEQRQGRREERMLLLQEQREENLKKQKKRKYIQEQKRNLRERQLEERRLEKEKRGYDEN